MAKFRVKKLPPIRLVDLLKKRKTNLKQFLGTYGIVAYSTLLQKCDSMGVSPPSEEEFKEVVGVNVSSPQEGVVVLDPPPLLKELTGQNIPVDFTNEFHPSPEAIEPSVETKPIKKNKEKKPKIDESIFVTNLSVEKFEKTGPDLGEQVSVEDDLDSSISKLSNLKKTK